MTHKFRTSYRAFFVASRWNEVDLKLRCTIRRSLFVYYSIESRKTSTSMRKSMIAITRTQKGFNCEVDLKDFYPYFRIESLRIRFRRKCRIILFLFVTSCWTKVDFSTLNSGVHISKNFIRDILKIKADSNLCVLLNSFVYDIMTWHMIKEYLLQLWRSCWIK